MVMQTAGFILWDGKRTIAVICDPEMDEETRKRFFDALMTLQLVYRNRKDSEEVCNALHPIASE